MLQEAFSGLITNAALLLLLGALYELLNRHLIRTPSLIRSLSVGLAVGLLGILLMLATWQFQTGIIFDTRSILLSVTGLFFGLVPTSVAAVVTAVFRIFQGGIGTLTGVSVILTSSALGLLWRLGAKKGLKTTGWFPLYLLGITVHAVMLLLVLIMPGDIATPALQAITLPVMLIFPVVTAVLGRMLYGLRMKNTMTRELSENKKRLDIIFESITDAVITTDSEGRIERMNTVAEQLTGWTLEEAEGKPMRDILQFHDEVAKSRLPGPFETLSEEKRSMAEYSQVLLTDKNGVSRVINGEASRMLDPDGNTRGIVLVLRDQTEIRKHEARLQRNAKLESIGVLAGGIAHDFNNLLSGLFGYIDLAQHAQTLKEASEYLENTLSVHERAVGLTNQLLTFAKGGVPVHGHIDLALLVRKTASFILSGSQVALTIQAEKEPLLCRGDKNQLAQVVENLILNARQAMPNGGEVVISLGDVLINEHSRLPLQAGKYRYCSISDTGIGIAPEHLQNIFDPFYTTKPDGTGLGLAICYSIIQKHGGLLDVSSVPGSGSNFTFYIPASYKEDEYSEAMQSSDLSSFGPAPISLPPDFHVLVLDDEPSILDINSRILTEAGCRVTGTTRGEQTLSVAKKLKEENTPIHMFILDLTVPGGMGGETIVEKLRQLYPDSLFIATSGYSANPVISDPAVFGFDFSLRKPFTRKQLLDVIYGSLR